MQTNADMPADVAGAFEALSDDALPRLLSIRDLIFKVAADTDGVGEIVETLKWGQPSYLTVRPKSGSTVRLGVSKDGRPALFCHCQTTLVREYRKLYDADFDFEGNRAVILKDEPSLPVAELEHCLALALTYHRRK